MFLIQQYGKGALYGLSRYNLWAVSVFWTCHTVIPVKHHRRHGALESGSPLSAVFYREPLRHVLSREGTINSFPVLSIHILFFVGSLRFTRSPLIQSFRLLLFGKVVKYFRTSICSKWHLIDLFSTHYYFQNQKIVVYV